MALLQVILSDLFVDQLTCLQPTVKKRQKLVDQLTDRSRGNDVFIFLLSSKVSQGQLLLIYAQSCVLRLEVVV